MGTKCLSMRSFSTEGRTLSISVALVRFHVEHQTARKADQLDLDHTVHFALQVQDYDKNHP